jgi:2-keto-4-pentenoate hydratase/2-oxohepta-3-ene-1,7-dioic acid hydratase in catechol pathway
LKLASVIIDGKRKAALVEGDEAFIVNVSLETVIAEQIAIRSAPGAWHKILDVRFDVPLRPPVLLCTGSNYRDHVDERQLSAETINALRNEFEFFLKAGQTIAGLNDPLVLDPAFGGKIDQETEVGIVIGPGCPRGVSEADAADHIFGYLIVNDITARDKQVRLTRDGEVFMQLGASKNFEGSTRLSAYVVTADEVDPYNLPLRTRVNGELTQYNSTANLINRFDHIIATFASGMALHPGCVISTGTPGGTGWGQDNELGGLGIVPPGCSPARYLHPGDQIESEIGGLGILRFEAVAKQTP